MTNRKVSGLLWAIMIASILGASTSAFAKPRRNSSLAITSPNPLPSGTVSTPYSASLTAKGGRSPYTWSIAQCSGSCNTGLGLSASGLLAGTPQNAGSSTFTFIVKDANGNTASAASGITIGSATSSPTSPAGPTSSPLTITSPTPLPSGIVSTPYSAQLAATGGASPYGWVITSCSGACNSGLGFTASGLLAGTPQNAGTSTLTFKVTDASGSTASAALGITIGSAASSPISPLSITSSSTLPGGTVYVSYNASLTAAGGTTPYSWVMKGCSGVCDPNLTFSQAGVFSGAPTRSGTSTYNVGVTDAYGQTASASMSLTIAAAPTNSTANYYVSPSGSNSNPCSQSSPCATPDYVVNNKASAGDTVQVAAGTYDYGSGAAVFTRSGTAGHYITVTCATRGACKIQNSVTGNGAVVEIDSNYFTFDGFEVTNTSSAGNNLALYVTSSYVNITRNIIHNIQSDCGDNGGGGIQIAGSGSAAGTGHDITMDSNLIYDINYSPSSGWRCGASTVQSDGILSETDGANIVVTNNIVHHTGGGWGMNVGKGAVVANNLVFATSNGGILNNGATPNTGYIINNMVFNTGLVSGQCGIMLESGSSIIVANNDTYGNSGADYCVEWGNPVPDPGTGDISVNPALNSTFVNWQADGSGDYHEKAGSPTIGHGNSTFGPPPATDFDGKTRQVPYDIGPHQY